MSDFESVYDEEKNDYVLKNATVKEGEMKYKLIKNCIDKINKKILESGLDKYYFNIDYSNLSLDTVDRDWKGNINDIDRNLKGKEHYKGIDQISGLPTLDFQQKEDETLGEYLERLEKYAENFSKYYDGHTVDESVRFDENGDLIEESKIEKSDYEKVATSREAVSELETGTTAKEIKEEMAQDNTNDKKVEGEEYD